MHLNKSFAALSAATVLGISVLSAPLATAQGGTTTTVSSELSSESSDSSLTSPCSAALSSVGLPLLILAPVALAAQGLAPGINGVIADAQAQVANVNTSLQQGLGIHDPGASAFADHINGQLGAISETVGPIVSGAALIGGGLLATGYVVGQCSLETESAPY